MCAVCKHLGGSARHMTGQLKKEKIRLSSIIDELEAFAGVRPLSTHEIELKNQSDADMAGFLREEELGANDQKLNSFWKEIRIQDTFIVWLMAGSERNLFTLFSKIRV